MLCVGNSGGTTSDGTQEEDGAMTQLRENRRIEAPPRPVRHTREVSVGLVGALAAAIGAFLFVGPADGMLRLFWMEFTVADVSEAWPLGLFVVGGLGTFAGFGMLARKLFFRDNEYSMSIVGSAILAAVGLVVALTFAVVWIV